VPYRYIPYDYGDHNSSVVTAPYEVRRPGPHARIDLLSAYAELLHGVRFRLRRHRGDRAQPVLVRRLAEPDPARLGRGLRRRQAEGFDPGDSRYSARSPRQGPREPLKIAEEYALLDCISGGRLIAGFPVGLSYDANLNASLPANRDPRPAPASIAS